MSENFASRLAEANLANKNDNVNFLKKITWLKYLKKITNDVQLYLILQLLCYIS